MDRYKTCNSHILDVFAIPTVLSILKLEAKQGHGRVKRATNILLRRHRHGNLYKHMGKKLHKVRLRHESMLEKIGRKTW